MSKLPDLQDCTIAIIGLGYVGLPLAIEFSKCKKSFIDKIDLERKIIGYDINQTRIKQLEKGIDITKEVEQDTILEQNNILFTSDLELLSEASIFIVTVPTPIDSSRSPDLTILKNACLAIGRVLKKDILKV